MRSLAMLSMLALTACAAATASQPPAQGSSAMICRGDDLGRFVGQPASEELGAEMLRTSGARNLRWVAKGMMVTMDFREDRLTVWLTADNRVERANCG